MGHEGAVNERREREKETHIQKERGTNVCVCAGACTVQMSNYTGEEARSLHSVFLWYPSPARRSALLSNEQIKSPIRAASTARIYSPAMGDKSGPALPCLSSPIHREDTEMEQIAQRLKLAGTVCYRQ